MARVNQFDFSAISAPVRCTFSEKRFTFASNFKHRDSRRQIALKSSLVYTGDLNLQLERDKSCGSVERRRNMTAI